MIADGSDVAYRSRKVLQKRWTQRNRFMNDEFIREVDEEYRRDKVAQVWKRYNTLIISVIVVVVVAVGGYRYWEGVQLSRSREASARFSEAVNLVLQGKDAEAEQAFAALAKDGPSGYGMLSRFRLASAVAAGNAEAGVKEFNALAADTGLDSVWRDLARLRSAILRMDIGDGSTAQPDLELLAVSNGPWRHTAREMLGLLNLQRNDYPGAGRWFDAIAKDSETPGDLRRRLELYSAIVAGGPVQAAN